MTALTEDAQDKILQLLINEGLLSQKTLKDLQKESARTNQSVISLLSQDKVIDEETLSRAIAKISGVNYVNLTNAAINQEVLTLLPEEIAERFMAVPIAEVENRIAVAMVDANNVQAVDYLANIIGRPLKVYMSSESGIRQVLSQYKTDLSSVDEAAEASRVEQSMRDDRSIKTIVQDSPISRALSTILEYAVKTRSSDVHIEPLEKSLKIRIRVDGVLREIMELAKSIEPALVSRIKILSNLKIDEHRIPQDGQFTVMVAGREVDLRIAISPVVWGEQVVIRLLDKSGSTFDLEEMGYAGRSLRAIRKGIAKPNGMVLTSGPTGSGKTTSLYALIKEIKSDAVNIVTLEDPVEYKMDGVNQIQVNAEVGLTFANGLRSILRQDPDIVMVGEIRDAETANLAVQAALTGHLVFSTLHTNSAAGIIPRLLDMGVEPFLIASTVNTVIGQRLVRRVSKNRIPFMSSKIETESINQALKNILPRDSSKIHELEKDLGYSTIPLYNEEGYQLVRGKETQTAPGGYTGRAGLYEVMDITEDIQNLIVKKATSNQIQKLAIHQGMLTMHQDGYLKALNGITTIEEVNRVASDIL